MIIQIQKELFDLEEQMGGLKSNDVVGNIIAGRRQDVCASFQAVMKSVFINLLETFFSIFTSV